MGVATISAFFSLLADDVGSLETGCVISSTDQTRISLPVPGAAYNAISAAATNITEKDVRHHTVDINDNKMEIHSGLVV